MYELLPGRKRQRSGPGVGFAFHDSRQPHPFSIVVAGKCGPRSMADTSLYARFDAEFAALTQLECFHSGECCAPHPPPYSAKSPPSSPVKLGSGSSPVSVRRSLSISTTTSYRKSLSITSTVSKSSSRSGDSDNADDDATSATPRTPSHADAASSVRSKSPASPVDANDSSPESSPRNTPAVAFGSVTQQQHQPSASLPAASSLSSSSTAPVRAEKRSVRFFEKRLDSETGAVADSPKLASTGSPPPPSPLERAPSGRKLRSFGSSTAQLSLDSSPGPSAVAAASKATTLAPAPAPAPALVPGLLSRTASGLDHSLWSVKGRRDYMEVCAKQSFSFFLSTCFFSCLKVCTAFPAAPKIQTTFCL